MLVSTQERVLQRSDRFAFSSFFLWNETRFVCFVFFCCVVLR